MQFGPRKSSWSASCLLQLEIPLTRAALYRFYIIGYAWFSYYFFHFIKVKICERMTWWGVSSVPFPIWFPFQLHCELVSSGISSQSVQNILIWHATYNEMPILVLSLLRFSEMTSELITFNHLRCHSSSTALENRTGYWKPTRRGTDETPQ